IRREGHIERGRDAVEHRTERAGRRAAEGDPLHFIGDRKGRGGSDAGERELDGAGARAAERDRLRLVEADILLVGQDLAFVDERAAFVAVARSATQLQGAWAKLEQVIAKRAGRAV